MDDVRVAELPAVEAQGVRADPGRQRDLVEKLCVPARDFQQELALFGVPVEGKVAVELLEAARLRAD